jgi:glycyl-tRNA synthetase beta chain
MAELLLEIGCEEIPARMIDAASAELGRRVGELLARERLAPGGHSERLTRYATPRRLSLLASQVADTQADVEEQVAGPSAKIAYKDGQPTPAAHAFAKKVGLNVSELTRVTTPKGEYVAAKVIRKGRSAPEILADCLPGEIASLYWPKSMYWRSKGETFVRPVRWVVAMLDGSVVPLVLDGIEAGRQSRGHRILHAGEVVIPAPNDYASTLEGARVIADPAERLRRIRKALDAATREVAGARWREDPALLDMVVNLTEWPGVVLGRFEREFLQLPQEVLVTVMRDHQKYFAVEREQGDLLPYFLAVLNTDNDSGGVIRHGHERVLRARFNDARFFWETDQKILLKDRVPKLKAVTFQKDLGSYHDKTLRVQRLASWLSETVKQGGMNIRPGVVHKAAWLAKADLTTELVKEFTELQGIVGGLYARAQQLDPAMRADAHELIAQAIYDQYKPESMEDSVPRTVEGAVLAVADKADSIAGMFALGLQPTGSKDPFALRRQGNGIVKIIAEHKLPVRLSEMMRDAHTLYDGSPVKAKFIPAGEYGEATRRFFHERLQFYLRDVRGFAYDVVNAVIAAGADDVVDAGARAQAVAKVRNSPDFESISVAFKRTKNILRQARESGVQAAPVYQVAALRDPAEIDLGSAIPSASEQVQKLRGKADYEQALMVISRLRPAVDKFFDKVMVMVDDAELRANRLGLLQTLLDEFSTMADFSEIVTDKGPAEGGERSSRT